MPINNNSGVDVVVFYITKHVETTGYCYTYGKFTGLSTTTLGNTLTVAVAASSGGSIKVVAFTTGNEASIGFYKYTDMPGVAAGDVWVHGVNCWGVLGYFIGTPVLNSCLTINDAGTGSASYNQ